MKLFATLIFLLALSSTHAAQRIAVIVPNGPDELGETLRIDLAKKLRTTDNSLAKAAYSSAGLTDHFNLTSEQGRNVGSLLGTDHFVIIRAESLTRQSVESTAYVESFAAVFVIESRSGRLIGFHLQSAKGKTTAEADANLRKDISAISGFITATIERAKPLSIMSRDSKFLPVPHADSPAAKDLKTPIPYRRIRPEYTSAAYLYSVAAAVEIEVDIDVDGSIARTSIERFAGFGLEESVEKAVRAMNWRPAMKNGKPLPMRVLLRYNFTKIAKDEVP